MSILQNISTNEKGHLTVGGIDTIDVAKDFKTPLMILDEEYIRNRCREYKSALQKYFNDEGRIVYASKAFCCKEICRIMADENMGLDVVSAGELYTAINAGFPSDRIYFHGNNKEDDELTLAICHGVGRIVVDNFTELERIEAFGTKLHKNVNVLLRIKPGVDAHTHDFIRTGQIDSKFGFALETGEAYEAVKACLSYSNINLMGIHCHIGSQIFETEPYQLAAKTMLGFMNKVKADLSYEIKELNLGGGFGARYTENDNPVSIDDIIGSVANTINKTCEFYSMSKPFIIFEPGRSIVAESGITLYKIGSVKEIPGVRNYVAVNGGMGDNPRHALYNAEYSMTIANKATEEKSYVATVAGRYCESGDIIGENLSIQVPCAGDILAVMSTGAYNYSMASNYNRIPRPAVVTVNKGRVKLIIKRETVEDVIKNDI